MKKKAICVVVETVGIKLCLHFAPLVTNPVTLRKRSQARFPMCEMWTVTEAIPRVVTRVK